MDKYIDGSSTFIIQVFIVRDFYLQLFVSDWQRNCDYISLLFQFSGHMLSTNGIASQGSISKFR